MEYLYYIQLIVTKGGCLDGIQLWPQNFVKGLVILQVHVKLTIEIIDKRLGPVKAEAEIAIKPVKAKGISGSIGGRSGIGRTMLFADENGRYLWQLRHSIKASRYIDEVLTTIPFEEIMGNANWKETVEESITADKLKEQLGKSLNEYQFSDLRREI